MFKPPSFYAFLKMCLKTPNRSNVAVLKDRIPFQKADLEKIHHPGNRPQITWLGHSSILLQYQKQNYLFDPLFSKRASPLPFLGPKRYVPFPLELEDLPPIDKIFVSHNHYDHLDLKTVKHFKNRTHWVIPKGLASWFAQQGVKNVKELSWWEKHESATATPSQHWSKRSFNDVLKSLWCSYAIEMENFKFYFGADSGFNQAMFEEIGTRLGPFDAAALPIGAYYPEWFMHPFHMSPEEAKEVHQIIGSKRSIPIHWGTYPMTFEPITEPVERLGTVEHFTPIAIGETLIL